MNKLKQFVVCCLMLIAVMGLVSCASQAPQPSQPVSSEKLRAANDILFTALGLVGTPYVYGGSTPDSGFDCSGLIQYVYAESAAISLPRTVAGMYRFDAPTVDESQLEAGDLVIFATGTGGRPSHAGIYVGDGRFVHAPSRGGEVRMDYLSDAYWQRRYLDAKRPLAAR
jgi:cell wall-associated NlpC family hydrolase